MIESQLNDNEELPLKSGKSKNKEIEIDLMDILHKIIGIRVILYRATGVGLIIGIIIALSIPNQYTVEVTLSPEIGSSKSSNGLSGIAASFLGSGAAIGDVSDALNTSLSADIVASTPFLLELIDTKVSALCKADSITLGEYLEEQDSPWWSYIIDLPGIVFGGVKSLFEKEKSVDKKTQGVIELTKEEYKKIKFLKKSIITSVDKKTGITTVSVTLQHPKITSIVASSVVSKLQEYIINYRTSKAKEDCVYLERLFIERQQEYYIAQKKYADYVDTHDNLILQSVRIEQERLQNEAGLAYQVYSQVANQLQVARAKVQEEKPVFAIVEPVVVPQQPSGLGLKIYIMLFVFLAVVFTAGWMLIGRKMWTGIKRSKK